MSAAETPKYEKSSLVIGGNPDFYPPYSKERQDAELELLRFGFLSLAKCLHQNGLLDMQDLRTEMSSAAVWFQDNPQTLQSAEWMLDTLDYMRAKLGPSPQTGEETAGR